MKRNILFGLLLFSAICYGQNFAGADVELLNDKELIVKELPQQVQKYGYKSFYTDYDFKKRYAPNNYYSKYEALVGASFTVVSSEPYTNSNGDEKFKLKLESEEKGILFYDYNPIEEKDFVFEVVGGLEFPAGYYCGNLVESKDKFNGEVSVKSPILDGISFLKVKKPTGDVTSLFIQEVGLSENGISKGVFLLLENGSKIEKPNEKLKVTVNREGEGFLFTATIVLDSADIKLLTQSKITDYRVHIHDGSIKNSLKLLDYIKCLTAK